jgi:hypothetical protein
VVYLQPVAIGEGVVGAVDEDVRAVDEDGPTVDEDVLTDDEDVHGNHAQALGSATSCQMPRIIRLVGQTTQRSDNDRDQAAIVHKFKDNRCCGDVKLMKSRGRL